VIGAIDCYDRSKLIEELKMVLQTPAPQRLTLNVMLERTETGQALASVLELPGYRVEAATEEQAIADLQQLVVSRLTKAKILPLEISLPQSLQAENPWAKYAGIFKDDPYFAKIAEQLRAEREVGDETPDNGS
jgi:hypothetical protein